MSRIYQKCNSSSPEAKVSALSKLKALADDKLNVTQDIKFVFPKRCWKSVKFWLPAFATFPTMFSKAFALGTSKWSMCGKWIMRMYGWFELFHEQGRQRSNSSS